MVRLCFSSLKACGTLSFFLWYSLNCQISFTYLVIAQSLQGLSQANEIRPFQSSGACYSLRPCTTWTCRLIFKIVNGNCASAYFPTEIIVTTVCERVRKNYVVYYHQGTPSGTSLQDVPPLRTPAKRRFASNADLTQTQICPKRRFAPNANLPQSVEMWETQ
jgi:hypothetical protein